jgi:hypothetical protein
LSPRIQTRRSLHGVAELLMAGPQFRRSGTIRLRSTGSGFGTVAEPAIEVRADYLVVNGQNYPLNATTCAELAAQLGIDAGRPDGVYHDGSGVALGDKLMVDGPAAARVAEVFARGTDALQRFSPDQTPVLWPEHFDVGISTGDVNYGVSPGDDYSEKPYAYVGPWTRRAGDFWNAPFGAAVAMRDLPTVEAVLEFFAAGRDHAAADPPAR